MKIDFANLQFQYRLYKDDINQAIQNVLDKSNYIMGDEVKDLEKSLEIFTGSRNAITCSSGTDALILSLMALDIKPGDEVITTSFTFISTAEAISLLGAIPIFVDINEKTYNIDAKKIEEKISEKTKAIIPVSLFGQPSDLNKIHTIAKKYDIKVIVDGAQSFGSKLNGLTDSNLGDISITSFFPSKPLGCYGDGGAIFTNNINLANKIKSLRLHGQTQQYQHRYLGICGRLDTLQAAVLNVKLKHYQKDLSLRQKVAENYNEALANSGLILPFVEDSASSSWAQYTVRTDKRDELQFKLKEKGIPSAIYYPIPLHLQEVFKNLDTKNNNLLFTELVSKEVLSLPMNPYLSNDEIDYIAGAI